VFAGKIFGVGLNKTGTSSLAAATQMLGYETMHNVVKPDVTGLVIRAAVERALDADQPPFHDLPELDAFDAFFDVRMVERHFEAFDRHYPGSRFILHHRDLASWLDSREAHVRRNIAKNLAGGSEKWVTVDRDHWTELWHDQQRRVRAHFADRPDHLLEIDVVAGQGWETLAPFLGSEAPDGPFPRTNVGTNPPGATRSALNTTRTNIRRVVRRANRLLTPTD